MTSKEIVKKAVLFQRPERIPLELPSPYQNDFIRFGVDAQPGWKPIEEGADEWFCVWEKVSNDLTMGQVKKHPLTDYSMLSSFKFPDYDVPERYLQAKELIKNNKDNKFLLANHPVNFIHRLEYLRGYENAYTDPYEHPEELNILLDKFCEMAMDSVKHFAEIGADGIISADDWGLQDRPLFSKEIFCKFFKPRYKKVYDLAHKYGMLTFLHSCGYIIDLLDDFIDMGVDVIEMHQQVNMGVENLSNRFGGRLCFMCPVDIQNVMIKGTIDDVVAYAKKLIKEFGKYNGGFIAQWYAAPDAVGHEWGKINAMCETFVKYGKYPLNI